MLMKCEEREERKKRSEKEVGFFFFFFFKFLICIAALSVTVRNPWNPMQGNNGLDF